MSPLWAVTVPYVSSLWELETPLPEVEELHLDPELDTLAYNYYNLDPNWHKGEKFNRVVLLEPSVFKRYPIEQRPMSFALELSKNIPNVKVFVGEFEDLQKHAPNHIRFKEHPLNNHYKGEEEPRDWMFDVHGYFPSFFAFWKRCKKQWKQPQTA